VAKKASAYSAPPDSPNWVLGEGEGRRSEGERNDRREEREEKGGEFTMGFSVPQSKFSGYVAVQ